MQFAGSSSASDCGSAPRISFWKPDLMDEVTWDMYSLRRLEATLRWMKYMTLPNACVHKGHILTFPLTRS